MDRVIINIGEELVEYIIYLVIDIIIIEQKY